MKQKMNKNRKVQNPNYQEPGLFYGKALGSKFAGLWCVPVDFLQEENWYLCIGADACAGRKEEFQQNGKKNH